MSWRANTIIRVCAAGHPVVTYTAKRDQPEPPCPVCGRVQRRPEIKESKKEHR